MVSGGASTPCPSDDTLAALVQRTLDPDELAQVTSHLDACVACQRVVLAAVEAGVGSPAAAVATGALTVPLGPASVAPPRSSGTRIGRYELRALLGIGGMGSVYAAHDLDLDRAVALKVLRPELGASPEFVERLARESRLMARVTHPAVITVYEVGGAGDEMFIAMEIIRGSTLAAWLAEHALGWRAIVELFERAGQGLAAAHDAGIVHRDFKPDNVLVARDADKVVVTDFGLAREAGPPAAVDPASAATLRGIDDAAAVPAGALDATVPTRMTAVGVVIGTPAYMAPEQIAGQPIDLRADVFAFSVALWEAVFRARPFPGRTLEEIAAAMQRPPARPAAAMHVPRRLVRALHRGLAIDPRDRWPSMPALLAELAAIRALRTRVSYAAGALGLVGLGLGAALVAARLEPAVDRCALGVSALDQAYSPPRELAVVAALAHEPAIERAVVGKLRATASAWRATQLATCRVPRDIIQDAATSACLEARRVELAGSVDDLIANGPTGARHAVRISSIPGDPSACVAPAPGLLFTRVPADPALRRQVTVLRARLADARDAAGRAHFQHALGEAEQVVDVAAPLWPPLHAEALLALGTIQRNGSELDLGVSTLLVAAATAERAHHDEAAADSWIQLVQAMAFDKGDPRQALEYAARAEAALDRVGRPRFQVMTLDYAKGLALIGANRSQTAETALREAARIAETTSAEALAYTSRALGTLYAEQGRHHDAVAMYRQANDRSPPTQPPAFDLLADSLARVGEVEQAEVEARSAVELADRTLPESQYQRPDAHRILATVLQDLGRDDDAVHEAGEAVVALASTQGKRSERYAEALASLGSILVYMGRHAQAEPLLARACDILAFAHGENGPEVAECEVSHGAALVGLRRGGEALSRLDHAIPVLSEKYGDAHWKLGDAIRTRGTAHAALGHHRAAIDDLERAIAILGTADVEPGYLASATWSLSKERWTDDPRRARAELDAALTLFDTANGRWARQREEAAAWFARHERRARRPLRPARRPRR